MDYLGLRDKICPGHGVEYIEEFDENKGLYRMCPDCFNEGLI